MAHSSPSSLVELVHMHLIERSIPRMDQLWHKQYELSSTPPSGSLGRIALTQKIRLLFLFLKSEIFLNEHPFNSNIFTQRTYDQ